MQKKKLSLTSHGPTQNHNDHMHYDPAPDTEPGSHSTMNLCWLITFLIAQISTVADDGLSRWLKVVSIISFTLLSIINLPKAYHQIYDWYVLVKNKINDRFR